MSNTLQEDYVGLEEVGDGVFDLYFCFYQIGRYDLREKRVQDIVPRGRGHFALSPNAAKLSLQPTLATITYPQTIPFA